MLGALINSLTGRTAAQAERQQEREKRKILSKHAIYGTEDYDLRSEAYDNDANRNRDAMGYYKNNIYGQ